MSLSDKNLKISATGPCSISPKQALEMIEAKGKEVDQLIAEARKVRIKHHGYDVELCAILNAKSGRCPEKCKFCSQSIHYKTNAPVYPLMSAEEIFQAALRARRDRACHFSIVTSGRGIRKRQEIETICLAISKIKEKINMDCCISVGEVSCEILEEMTEAGLDYYHHNIETAPSFHSEIILTHSFEDEQVAIARAKKAGVKTCCGGIFGMGESNEQRIEFLFKIKEIDPDRVPINFLNPITGTPLENSKKLSPEECLKLIAIARLIMPEKPIIICGGREVNLGPMQELIFDAGATGMMVGDYLTTKGQSPSSDFEMIKRAGYNIKTQSLNHPIQLCQEITTT